MDSANGYIMCDETREIGRFPAWFLDCGKWDYEKAAFPLATNAQSKSTPPWRSDDCFVGE